MALREVEKTKVLVVAPHMDDEVIGPGGTLALHRERGSEIHVVFCAAGANPEVDATRTREARACAELMGFIDLRWLGFPEGEMSLHEAAVGQALAQIIDEIRPEVVFVPYPTDHHRDHTATAFALAEAINASGWCGMVWCFEVWSPLWPNTAVDISSVVDVKRAAIALHESQTAGLHYTDGALGLNRYRSLRVYVDYAEAFWVAREEEFMAVVAEMSRI